MVVEFYSTIVWKKMNLSILCFGSYSNAWLSNHCVVQNPTIVPWMIIRKDNYEVLTQKVQLTILARSQQKIPLSNKYSKNIISNAALLSDGSSKACAHVIANDHRYIAIFCSKLKKSHSLKIVCIVQRINSNQKPILVSDNVHDCYESLKRSGNCHIFYRPKEKKI